jgi:histidine triad (HIT) family protein
VTTDPELIGKVEALASVHSWQEVCPFCKIVAGLAPAQYVASWPDAIAIVPLKPVVEGHVLVIPRAHVADFTTDPEVTAAAGRRAAELGNYTAGAMNLITSKGEDATQSVFHLHIHLVPRVKDDGLALPWYSGKGNHR